MIRWKQSVLPWCGVADSRSKIRGGFGESLAQAIAGDLFGAAAEPVGFVADDQIPTGVDQVAEAFLVVGFELLAGPAASSFDGLDGIGGADDLIELPPDVLGSGEIAPRGELARYQEPEFLAEVGLHLLHPLGHEALGGDDQHPFDEPPELEFPEDQPSFDGLAQADLIGQEVTNPVAGDGTSESVQLVRQRDHACFERGQQHVLGQGVGDPGGGHGVGDPIEAGRLRRLTRGKGFGGNSFDRGQTGNPDLIDGVAPDRLDIENAHGLTVGGAEGPGADGKVYQIGQAR